MNIRNTGNNVKKSQLFVSAQRVIWF